MAESRPYIPRDLMGVPIPQDATLNEIRDRYGGGSLPQSETQRLVSELDLSAEDPELLSEKDWYESRRKSFDDITKKHFDKGRKRKGRFNQEVDEGIKAAITGSKQFENNPDALEVAENIAMDVIPHAASALATATDPIYKHQYKRRKRELKQKKYEFLGFLQKEYDLSPETSEAVAMAVLGLAPLILNGELEIDRQQFNLGPATIGAGGELHFDYENPEDARVQYDIDASTRNIAGSGVDAEARIRGTNLDFGYDAEATAREVLPGVDIAGGFRGDTAGIERANLEALYRDEGFSGSVGAVVDPDRLEDIRANIRGGIQDLLGAGERINVGVTGYPLVDPLSARFDIDAGVPLGPGYLSGQTSGTITEGPTYLSGQYEVPLGPGRFTAGVSTDLGDEIAGKVGYTSYWDKGGIVDLQTNETASEVLAQSNTKTPDFMAPVLLPNPQPFQEGGIASLPNSPVLAGQQHMLAYITPEEASRLRAQGGGVTPTGGQYRGPGGIASFWAPGVPGAAAAAAAAAGAASAPGGAGHGQAAGKASPPSTSSVGGTSAATGTGGLSPDVASVDAASDRNLFNIALDFSNEALANAKAKEAEDRRKAGEDDSDPWATKSRRTEVEDAIRRRAILSQAVEDGYVPNLQSLHNLAATLDHQPGDDGGFFGLIQGYKTPWGQTLSTPADVLGLGTKGYAKSASGMQTIGDPESPFGMAVLGLAPALMTMLAPPLTLPLFAMEQAYGLANPKQPSLGLMGLAEQASGTTLGEVVGDVSQEMGLGRDPLGLSDFSFTGYIGDLFSPGNAVEAAPPATDAGDAASTVTTPYSPGGPGLPAIQSTGIPPVNIEGFLPTTTETLLDATSSYYDAQQLADATGTTLAQAEDYLADRYADDTSFRDFV
jgi:hypothetical protein